MLTYLLFPRPGPFFGAGKIAFFFLGTGIALTSGTPPHGFRTWLLMFVFYELVLSQGKYFLNDYAGRRSDRSFERGASNRFPSGGRKAVAVAAYALARLVGGVVGLLLIAGPLAALLGALTILLQVAYELTKLAQIRHRGLGLFLIVSANYGVRALAGIAAVASGAIISLLGLLTFAWAAGAGALFLSVYWQRQGAFYLEGGRAAPELLARYKPGVLAIYRRQSTSGRWPRSLPDWLLRSLLAGAAAFMLIGPAEASISRLLILPVALAALAALTYLLLTSAAAAPVLAGRGERNAA